LSTIEQGKVKFNLRVVVLVVVGGYDDDVAENIEG
jgi:hypothetical protein